MLDKKPTLSDYGLTKEMVENNQYSEKYRSQIIKENNQIEENARKSGWTIFGVAFAFGILLAAGIGTAAAFLVPTILGGIVGYICNKSINDGKRHVPPPVNTEITKKYAKYLDDLNKYNEYSKQLELKKDNEPEKTYSKKEISQNLHIFDDIQPANIKTTQKTTISKSTTILPEKKTTFPIKTDKTPTKDISTIPEKGMYIRHSKFGDGRVVSVDTSSHLARIFFSEDGKYRQIDYTLVNLQVLHREEPKPIEQPKPTINKVYNYEIGMEVKHKTLGVGVIHDIDKATHVATIKFNGYYQTKKIDYSVAELEILSNTKDDIKPQVKQVVEVTPTPSYEPKYVKIYSQSKVKLTQEQSDLFDEMLKLSKKYCVDIDVSEWKNLVGVGLIGQEHLRYWLLSKSGAVYVKFADLDIQYPFTVSKKDEILSLTKRVNELFEENPDDHLLDHLKTASAIEKIFKETPEDEIDDELDEEDVDTDIFEEDVDDDFNKEIIEEISSIDDSDNSIDYDKSIFEIQGTKLIKCKSNFNTSNYPIPKGVTEISDNAFSNNNFVYYVDIPKTVTTIQDNAFNSCRKLRDLMLPSSITYIGQHVFDGCENLETIFCETKAVKKLLLNLPKHIEIVCLE